MKNLRDYILNNDNYDVVVVSNNISERDQQWLATIMWLRSKNIGIHPLPRIGFYIRGRGRVLFATPLTLELNYDNYTKAFVTPGVMITDDIDELPELEVLSDG